jgi:hypothetical protein
MAMAMPWLLSLIMMGQVPETTPFETVAQGSNSGVAEPLQVVVRTAADWEALWKQHGAKPPAQPIDFASEAVVALFLGERPTGGYRVQVVAVRPGSADDAGDAIVEYVVRSPGRGDIVTQVVTTPFHIVKLPTNVESIRFERVDGDLRAP